MLKHLFIRLSLVLTEPSMCIATGFQHRVASTRYKRSPFCILKEEKTDSLLSMCMAHCKTAAGFALKKQLIEFNKRAG
jgi:hypothetical protein